MLYRNLFLRKTTTEVYMRRSLGLYLRRSGIMRYASQFLSGWESLLAK